MIQPQELRIGNYVDVFDKIDEIKSINENEHGGFCKFKNNPYQYYLFHNGESLIKPIPLTEEILLKLGFNEVEGERWCDMHEEFEECNYYHLSMFEIYYNPETDRFEDDSLDHFNVNLKYVHQLQNLYFALTGEELTFKK